MFDSVFAHMGLIVGLAAVGGASAQLLRQPLTAFIAIGIVLGPSVQGLDAYGSEIELFARLGIALLLFIVGLKLDLHVVRTIGPVALSQARGLRCGPDGGTDRRVDPDDPVFASAPRTTVAVRTQGPVSGNRCVGR
jgi:hypothetical protein